METTEHTLRLFSLCSQLAIAIGIDGEKLEELELLCRLHDIGKVTVNENILHKPGPLNDDEWAIMRKHPVIGYYLLMSIPGMNNIAELVLYHHERWDGAGYPAGLKGEEIPLLSRVVALADAYDAMTNDRAYRKAISHEEATKELKDHAGTQFDPQLVEIFTSIHNYSETHSYEAC